MGRKGDLSSGEQRYGRKYGGSELRRLWRIFKERSTSVPKAEDHEGFQNPCGLEAGVDTGEP